MSNRASRRGIGVSRSDHDRVSTVLLSVGCEFTETTRIPRKKYDEEYEFAGRRKVTLLTFETTTLVFNAKGQYLGRIYMSRDECDYFTASTKGDASQ